MKVTKSPAETTPGPSDSFTGAVYIDAVATPVEGARLSANNVHFTPGARTAWEGNKNWRGTRSDWVPRGDHERHGRRHGTPTPTANLS
jgi:hypothetical protein